MKVKAKIKNHYDPFTDKEAEEKEAEYFKMLENIGIIEKENKNPYKPYLFDIEERCDHEEEDLKNELKNKIETLKYENEDDEGIDWKEKYKSLLKDYIQISLKLSNLEDNIRQLKRKMENLKYENEDLSNRIDEKENNESYHIKVNELIELCSGFEDNIDNIITTYKAKKDYKDNYLYFIRQYIFEMIRLAFKFKDYFESDLNKRG